MRIEVKRWKRPDATYSDGFVIDDLNETVFYFKGLELPWKDNERSISCIPDGEYEVFKEGPTEKRPYVYFRVQNVPGRSGILWHPGNYTHQIKGCYLPGKELKYLDDDKTLDITETTATLKKITDLMPDKFRLKMFDAEK